MTVISVVHAPTEQQLNEMGVYSWPVWEKEASSFPWFYDEKETAYLLEGEVVVTPDNGEPAVTVKAGDLVIFPAGLSCRWEIKKNLRKHYQFG